MRIRDTHDTAISDKVSPISIPPKNEKQPLRPPTPGAVAVDSGLSWFGVGVIPWRVYFGVGVECQLNSAASLVILITATHHELRLSAGLERNQSQTNCKASGSFCRNCPAFLPVILCLVSLTI